MDIQPILKNKWVQTSAISVVAFVGGSALGYILGKRKVKREMEELQYLERLEKFKKKMDTKIRDVVIRKPDQEVEVDLDRKEEIERRYNDVIDDRNLKEERERTLEEDMREANRYTTDDPNWDYEAELSTRQKDIPYIIHADEFINDEMDFQQETLNYYAGDDIMSDTDDTPIYNYQGLMGELNFGHGSGDPNVVYIRNEKIRMEWEVLFNPGYFSQEVLGLQMEKAAEEELHHSVLKFRRE